MTIIESPFSSDGSVASITSPITTAGTNVTSHGHGWVRPRADGVVARCGGPGICPTCQRELAQTKLGANQ